MINHFRTGPRNETRLSKASYVQFVDTDDRARFLSAAGGKNTKFDINGHKFTMKPAKTAMNMQRDWALRKAAQMLSEGVSDKSAVVTDWKERVVKVQGAVAFAQEQGALGGTFKGSHAH
eukprot:7742762-Alexandrium_andersonii.AAC.1